MRARLLAVAVVIAVVAVAALLVLGPSHARTYHLVFENAGQLVKGDQVQIGGIAAGTVKSIGLTPRDQADVTVSVDSPYAPLHAGTTAVIRGASLSGVANRYISITPGPNWRAKLADDATLGPDSTTTVVDLDQVFDAFDAPTRRGLRNLLRSSADQYRGKEPLANQSAHYLDPSLQATVRLADELDADSGVFRRFLTTSGRVMSTLAAHRAQLSDLVGNAAKTSGAIAGENRSLSTALNELPPTLRQGNTTFVDLRSALGDLQRLSDATRPVTRPLAPFLRQLGPVLAEAVPTFHQLRRVVSTPGRGNDLIDNLHALPRLSALAAGVFPRARTALRKSQPVVEFIRPYIPDLVGWFRDFGQSAAYYDANGHYARVMPVFDAFNFVDDAQGGHLEAKPADQRGQSPFLHLGNLRRCPGSAGPLPADGSAPFVGWGPSSNGDCNPSEVVRP
jgi:phospholipid/cholesterol/gamma-HCH transport system substrate-binding protein